MQCHDIMLRIILLNRSMVMSFLYGAGRAWDSKLGVNYVSGLALWYEQVPLWEPLFQPFKTNKPLWRDPVEVQLLTERATH